MCSHNYKGSSCPRCRFNRCMSCEHSAVFPCGSVKCLLDHENKILGINFIPIPENLPVTCSYYKFVVF